MLEYCEALIHEIMSAVKIHGYFQCLSRSYIVSKPANILSNCFHCKVDPPL